MKFIAIIFIIAFSAISIIPNAISQNICSHDVWDEDIFVENKKWVPSITSGPTILVASNMSTITNQNGEDVKVQLSNNNVGIGTMDL